MGLCEGLLRFLGNVPLQGVTVIWSNILNLKENSFFLSYQQFKGKKINI